LKIRSIRSPRAALATEAKSRARPPQAAPVHSIFSSYRPPSWARPPRRKRP
jgi:hypothetical protein